MTATVNEKSSNARIVHFSVAGDFLTRRAREHVEDGQWRQGFDFLMTTLVGMDAQVAMEILQGKKKLVGVDDIRLADDDSEEEVAEWLKFHFGNCFLFNKKCYRPYGFVSAYDHEDIELAATILRGEDAQMLQNKNWLSALHSLGEGVHLGMADKWAGYKYRAAYYAYDRRYDICVNMALPGKPTQAVLCALVEIDLPLWYKVTDKAVEAIRHAYEEHTLRDLYADMHPSQPSAYDRTQQLLRGMTGRAAPEREQVQENGGYSNDGEPMSAEEDAAEAEKHLAIFREQISHFANTDTEYGWFELSEYDEKDGRNVSIRVPHRAFICAALSRAHAHHLKPEYKARCPIGLKLEWDDQYHSDAWVGAGFHPTQAYDEDMPEQRLFMRKLYELQREKLSFQFDLLARGQARYVSGEVIHDPEYADEDKILVLKEASPQYADAAIRCAAVIVETGSKLAHMVIVSREECVPVIRLEGALHKFRPPYRVSIDLTDGVVVLLDFA